MKKSIFALLLALIGLCACQTEEKSSLPQDEVIYAAIEDAGISRTFMDDFNNVRWSEGDHIVAYLHSSLGVKYQVSSRSVGKTSAEFLKVANGNDDNLYAGTELEHNVVLYPYLDGIYCDKVGENYVMNINLHSEQEYVQNSFAVGSMPMVAVSDDNSFTFKNVCGGIKLLIKGNVTVASVKVEGKNNERLSGDSRVVAYTDGRTPYIEMSENAMGYASVQCGASGVFLSQDVATEFIIALPPVVFSNGFIITVADVLGNTYSFDTDKQNVVLRSSLLIMPEIEIQGSLETEKVRIDLKSGTSGTKSSLSMPYEVLFDASLEGQKAFVNGKEYTIQYDGTLYVMAEVSEQYLVGYPSKYFSIHEDSFSINFPVVHDLSAFEAPYAGICYDYNRQCAMSPMTSMIRVDISPDFNCSYFEFYTNGGEALNGEMKYSYSMLPSGGCSGTEKIKVECSGLETVYCWIPPVTATSGIGIALYDEYGNELTRKSTQNALTFQQKMMISLGSFYPTK